MTDAEKIEKAWEAVRAKSAAEWSVSADTQLLWWKTYADQVDADNARMRALVKDAEWSGATGREGDPACPWCSAEPKPIEDGLHAADCPAFTPSGEVK